MALILLDDCWEMEQTGRAVSRFLMCSTFVSVALNTVQRRCIQRALAGFVLSSGISVTELVYFCCEDKQCCLVLEALTACHVQQMSGPCESCPCVGPGASAFYANVVPRTKYRSLTAKGQSSVFKPVAQHRVRLPF